MKFSQWIGQTTKDYFKDNLKDYYQRLISGKTLRISIIQPNNGLKLIVYSYDKLGII